MSWFDFSGVFARPQHRAYCAIIFSDLIGKLDVLRVRCDKCGRDGCYGLSRLIDKHGRDGKVIDWLDELN